LKGIQGIQLAPVTYFSTVLWHLNVRGELIPARLARMVRDKHHPCPV
jgi:hypothetical protein